MRGRYVYEGIALPEAGWEDDFLRLGEPTDQESLGICRLLSLAAGCDIPANVNHAFEFEGDPLQWEGDRDLIEEYRRASGHEYPPIFRVRIEVTAERCSAEETAAYWKAYRKRFPRGRGE